MTLQFTQHAVERYIQFHLLDAANPDPRDVRALLESHARDAIKLSEKTFKGDTQWRIESLGIVCVSKHDDGIDVVVTILPPSRFRGLTPEVVERLEADRRRAELAAEHARVEHERKAAEYLASLERDRIEAERLAFQAQADAAKRKEERQRAYDARMAHAAELAEAKTIRVMLHHEHELLAAVLRTARHQLSQDINSTKRALRIAMRFLRAGVREGVVVREEPWDSMSGLLSPSEQYRAVAAINPALASDEFIDGGDDE